VPKVARRPEACLIVIYGAELGKRVPVGSASFEIGRSPKCDLTLDQEAVSRQHARITYTHGHFDGAEQGYRIRDLGSTNGTLVNDVVAIDAPLVHGDQLKVGRTILKFMAGNDIELHYHEEIYRVMTVDGLTRAFNKRYFVEALERECNRATRYARDLSVATFDVDELRKVNSGRSHLAGDALLQQVIAALKVRLRREDVIARIGGGEFAVLLPEVGIVGARVTGEKIRAVVEGSTFAFEGIAMRCTASVGVAAFDATCSPKELMDRAERALAHAKLGGRNGVFG
jgi:diguanylate cyclase (GGDEF)-like protein